MILTLDKLNAAAFNFNMEMADRVETISAPLLKNFGITNFGYARIFPDGTMLRLSADKNWSEKYFSNQFYNDPEFYNFADIPENRYQIRYFTNKPNGRAFEALYEHNLWNIFTLFKRNKEYVEVWFYATDRNKCEMINFYANNTEVLKNFNEYFLEVNASLLNSVKSDCLIVTELKLFEVKIIESENVQAFLASIGKQAKINKMNLSEREKECVEHLILGKSAKEIARVLNISPRTVEVHFRNIKMKTGCKRLSQLINRADRF